MSEIVKSEYNALGEDNNYKTHFFKTSADQVVGLGRLKSFSYEVNDVVYSDTNNKVALKCITGGTTSNAELNISTKNIGDTVTDGSVVWQVCNRTSDVTSVNGKTGDVVVDLEDLPNVLQAVEQVQTGLNSVENKLPSDMTDYIVESYRNGTEWYEVYKSGKVRQGGWLKATSSSRTATITFLKPFADTNYNPLGMPTGGTLAETITWQYAGVVYGSNKNATNMKVRVGPSDRCNGYTWIAEGQGA